MEDYDIYNDIILLIVFHTLFLLTCHTAQQYSFGWLVFCGIGYFSYISQPIVTCRNIYPDSINLFYYYLH